ncbi:SRPBCC family protein [Streptomyces sp. WAC 00631]|uniref:SRPBCC family protein n=1 Tax=unclassified Streptomyces TaxID=2593676 RepID=UPI000F7BA880|nr:MULTISPECIES: SRPBCC family protein [unclassified Streptomyces]MCC5037174.1 SRPBCC family protein [Streptomyces sp. WAC 00631]MCC9737776.1 SRPBCC family protein [Streptomyces sp. MNU89]
MPEKDQNGNGSGVERLRKEFGDYLGAKSQRLVESAGGRLSDLTGRLTDAAENGGSLPKVGARVLGGESPAKAFMGEKAKGVKDNVVGKAKEAVGAGGGESKGKKKPGDVKVTNIVETLDVGLSLRTCYDYWCQFEDFSDFMKGVRHVSKSDEVTSDWKAKVGPSTRGWQATIDEQIPDERIVWNSEGAKGTTRGCVSFHELAPNLTRIVVVVEYYPSGFLEKTANIWRAQGRRLRLDLKHFQRYVTLGAEEEPEGWRGEIRDGEVVRSHEDAMEEEKREGEEGEEEQEGEEEPEGEEGEEEDEEEEEEDEEDEYEDGEEDEEEDEEEEYEAEDEEEE